MEKIQIRSIKKTPVTIPGGKDAEGIQGHYYQMDIEDSDGIERFVNLFFDYEGKHIYMIDPSNKVKLTFLDEDFLIGQCQEGQQIDVVDNKVIGHCNTAAILVCKQ